jgi:solute carrier family 6 GABA transporter-like protein 1
MYRFNPYLLAVVVSAIPVLILEVTVRNAHRAGPAVAYTAMNNRPRNSRLGLIFVGFMVLIYLSLIVSGLSFL